MILVCSLPYEVAPFEAVLEIGLDGRYRAW